MCPRYTIHFDGPLTSITEHPAGPWPRWQMARAAAIEHLEQQVRECSQTLMCIRRAGCFFEYELLREEREANSLTD